MILKCKTSYYIMGSWISYFVIGKVFFLMHFFEMISKSCIISIFLSYKCLTTDIWDDLHFELR